MEKLDVRLIFAILNGEVTKAINRLLQQNLAAAGFNITPEQWSVLDYLSANDGVKQQQLCDAIFCNQPSMSRLIDNMERSLLVIRVGHPTDRRARRVYLTSKGKDVQERAQKVMLRTLKVALSGLGLDDIRVSQEVLRRVFENITGKAFAEYRLM